MRRMLGALSAPDARVKRETRLAARTVTDFRIMEGKSAVTHSHVSDTWHQFWTLD